MINSTLEQHFFGASIAVPVAANATAVTLPDTAPADIDTTSLGATEREILQLIAKGLVSPQIARSLSINPDMVDVYRRNIMRKLHLPDDAALAEYARRIGPGIA
jgi:DNA-binding CsgD family transcriptional regulator